jgi:chromosomal replication initiator protein
MTSDRPVSEIGNLQKRLVSRFEWGLVTEMEMADLETRVAILRRKREQMGIQLPDDSCSSSRARPLEHPQAEGSLLRAASYASLTRKPLTPEALIPVAGHDRAGKPDRADDRRHPADGRGILRHPARGLTSKQRPNNIAFPRQIAMYLCRK